MTPLKRGLLQPTAQASQRREADVRRMTPLKRGLLQPTAQASQRREADVRRMTPLKRGLLLVRQGRVQLDLGVSEE